MSHTFIHSLYDSDIKEIIPLEQLETQLEKSELIYLFSPLHSVQIPYSMKYGV